MNPIWVGNLFKMKFDDLCGGGFGWNRGEVTIESKFLMKIGSFRD
jgi:hypothetical protein